MTRFKSQVVHLKCARVTKPRAK